MEKENGEGEGQEYGVIFINNQEAGVPGQHMVQPRLFNCYRSCCSMLFDIGLYCISFAEALSGHSRYDMCGPVGTLT
jgi:hypothetical protein